MGSVDVGKCFQDDPHLENRGGNGDFWIPVMARNPHSLQSTER